MHARVLLTTRGPDRSTMQLAKPLTDVDDTLGRLRWILLAVTIGGVGVASGLGVAVSRAATRPLGRLTATAEQVTATGELHHRIEPVADDEPGRLAAAFNAMLGALESSRDAQRQLVADASHELRTPLTSIRANVELLERARDMPPPDRTAILASVRGQLEDLTILVGDLVDLARPGGRPSSSPRTCASTRWCRTPWSARAATRPRPTSPSRPSPAWSAARALASHARSATSSTTRSSGARRARPSR